MNFSGSLRLRGCCLCPTCHLPQRKSKINIHSKSIQELKVTFFLLKGAVAPAKTPEVQAAEAAHFAAKGAYAYAPGFYNGYYAGAWNGAYPYNFGYAGYPGYYNGYLGGLVAHPNGAVVPVDEPAVAAAKAEHFAAHGLPVAAAPVAPVAYAAGYPGLVAHPNGALVPVEPADVQAARADHLAAHA